MKNNIFIKVAEHHNSVFNDNYMAQTKVLWPNKNTWIKPGKGKPSEYFPNLETEFFHVQLKPVLNLLRILGALPIEISKSGVPNLRLCSAIVIYSICLYLTIMVSTFLNIRDLTKSFKKDNFNSNIYNTLQIFTSSYYIILPVFVSLDTKKILKYIKGWTEYQLLFLEVTKQVPVLGIKRQCYFLAVTCICSGCGTLWLHFYYPYVPWENMPNYIIMAALSSTVIVYWFLTFKAIVISGENLSKCFKSSLTQESISAEAIGRYRILWLRLSLLISETGTSTGKIFTAYLTGLLSCLTMCLYGCLSEISNHSSNSLFIVAMVAAFLITIIPLFFVCNEAEIIASVVRKDIQQQLQFLTTWRLLDSVQYEVSNFLGVILMNPPVISILGFVDINRSFFRTYVSSLVTYLIVLLQFNVGQPEDKTTYP